MITTEQHARDQQWLKVPPLDAINAGLADLQAALDAAKAELERLDAVRDADPGYAAAKNWPAPSRFITTEAGRAADEKIWAFEEITRHSWVATDFIRRRANGSKQKYPLTGWAKLARQLRRWVVSK